MGKFIFKMFISVLIAIIGAYIEVHFEYKGKNIDTHICYWLGWIECLIWVVWK